jgi:hypothetical protein
LPEAVRQNIEKERKAILDEMAARQSAWFDEEMDKLDNWAEDKRAGLTGNTYKALFRSQILRVKPPVFGMAVAYVSASGFSLVKKILDEGGVGEVRLITDTKDGVTMTA